MSKKLTLKEESLCQAMLLANDQSEAFRRSDYATDNMNAATVHKQASRYFNKPQIRARMVELTQDRNDRQKIDADWVLNEAVSLYKDCREKGENGHANKALDSIGKHVDVQAWSEKKEITGKVDLNTEYTVVGVPAIG